MLVRLIALLLLITISSFVDAPVALAAGRSATAVEKDYKTYLNAGNYAAALNEAQTLAAMLRASKGEQSINYAIALGFVASCLQNLDRYNESIPYFLQAIAIVDNLPRPNRNMAVALRAALGGVYVDQRHLPEAETLFREAIALFDQTVTPMAMHDLFNNYGNLLEKQSRYRESEEMHRRAIALYAK
jgi:tetratricopeptide (TPR) repeat protein